METVSSRHRVGYQEVHAVLGRHLLVDGLHLVMDLERSHGVRIFDGLRGREVLDFFGAFSTIPVGYNHHGTRTEEFRRRILPAALNKPSSSDIYTPELAEFVSTFARTLPPPLRNHLFFIEGGALAVENALKAAFDWKVRKNLAAGRGERGTAVLHFRQAFHGRSGYTLSLTNTADPRKIQYFPKFSWPRVSNPKLSFPVTPEVLADVEAAERRTLEEIEAALAADPDGIAALLLEPIQGEGGDNHFRPEFLHALRALADEAELLLVFDEVQTGFGTTGRWWCCEHFEVLPDILVFGKKSQVCGIAATARLDEVDSVFRVPSRINSTWGGNLVDMVRCQRFIEIIEEEALLENAVRVGEDFLAGLRDLEGRFPGQVTNARGRGLMLAFDLPDRDLRTRALRALNERDLLALPSGERAIRFRPALVIREADVDEGLDRLARTLHGLF